MKETVFDYDERALSVPKGVVTVAQAEKLAERFLREIDREDMIENIRAETARWKQYVTDLLRQPQNSATNETWHNFAVAFARHDYYGIACQILDTALVYFPNDTDLLADYLQYGIQCGRAAECEKHYQTLRLMPHVKYTWRAFSFQIRYLMYRWEQSNDLEEMKELENEMFALVKDFRKFYPDDEDSYSSEAEVNQLLRRNKQMIQTLNAALSKLKKTPKCALRLADILFEQGEYKDALVALDRALQNSDEPQATINISYVYCLSGLSKLAKAQLNGEKLSPDTIKEIFYDFNLSLENGARNKPYRKTIVSKTKELLMKYDFQIPSKCSMLRDEVNG